MSNSVNLVATKFINLTFVEGESYGYRIYDDYGAFYCNLLTKEEANSSDEDLLYYATNGYNATPEVDVMIEFAKDNGMFINETYYTADEVQKMLHNIQWV